MRVRLLWVGCLLAVLVPRLFGAGIPGEPDEGAFRHWRITSRSPALFSGLAYGKGVWVGVGSGIHYSTNGVDWSVAVAEFYRYSAVTYADGVFVAVGEDSFAVMASTNGIHWRAQYSLPPLGPRILDVAYGNGLFVSGGSGTSFLRATNNGLWWTPGQWWTSANQPFFCQGLFFGGGKFVATGSTSNAATATSTNGRDWAITLHPHIGGDLRDGTWHNGRFIVVGLGGAILISDDGENWTQRPSPTTNYLSRVAADDNQYVAVGDRVMLISTNGLDWEQIPLIASDSYFTDLIVADNSFVAVYREFSTGHSTIYRSNPFHYAAPSFAHHPVHTEQRIGLATNLTAAANGTFPLTYQWQKNGVDIPGATGSELAFAKLERSDDATYRVMARNTVGETASAEARLTVGLPASVITHPLSQSVAVGGAVTFSAAVEGTPPITNRWRQPGSVYVTQVMNEATAFLRLENVQPANGGVHGLLTANKYGQTASRPAMLTVLTDADLDGLPDAWEAQHGLTEPGEDFDTDGATNLEEYHAGTDPRDGQSFLKVERIDFASGGSAAIVRFLARSNHTYTIQGCEDLASVAWRRVADVVAAPADRHVVVTNSIAGKESYFRLATPRVDPFDD